MGRSKSDLMAVAAVVGGGLIASGVTLALANGAALPSMECATTVGSDADVMVSLGDEGLVMVRPDVRVHEARACMDAESRREVTIQLRDVDAQVHVDREKIKREVEQARREVEEVQREVDRVRDRVRDRVDRVRRGDVRDAERALARAEREMQRALVRREGEAQELEERALRERERALATAREAVDQARMERRSQQAFELARDLDLEALDREALDAMVLFEDGLRIDLPEQSFEFRFEGLDDLKFDGLEDALRIQLEVLEGLDLEFEGVDEELEAEIESRIEQKMRELEERLERIRGGSGR